MDNIFLDTESQPADINIVLTDRKLSHQGRLLRGVAQTLPNKHPLGTRIAIVSTYQNDLWAATTDHELGHNLNLPHCDDEECIMGLDLADEDCLDTYCQGCTNQLHKNIDRLQRAKMGRTVSKRALFPTFYSQFPEDPFFTT